MSSRFVFRECANNACRFRYPTIQTGDRDPVGLRCPACGSATRVVAERSQQPEAAHLPQPPQPPPPLSGMLDNVRSVFNAGSIFRSADGAGLRHLYLTGMTPTPDHPKFAKTALGAEKRVPWSHTLNGVETAARLSARGMRLWALEDDPRAEPLFDCRLPEPRPATHPIVLIVGNELAGVDPGILALCDKVIAIPMWGMKQSLNVAIAFGIAVYWLRGIASNPPTSGDSRSTIDATSSAHPHARLTPQPPCP